MELSSPRFKALAVSAGFSFWFFIITSILGVFALEYFFIFIAIIFPLMQFLSKKVSGVLDIFAIYNTKFFSKSPHELKMKEYNLQYYKHQAIWYVPLQLIL